MKAVKTMDKLRKSGGFSLAETLVAMLILSLVAGAMAGGVMFAREQYRKCMILSESKALCSTLSDVIKDQLRNAESIRSVNSSGATLFTSRDISGGDSCIYTKVASPGDEYGELWIGDPTKPDSKDNKNFDNGKRLISSASYSIYHLQAKVNIDYDKTEERFHVILTIRDAVKNRDTVESTFDVFCLNDTPPSTP